jgi:hypothetical protein
VSAAQTNRRTDGTPYTDRYNKNKKTNKQTNKQDHQVRDVEKRRKANKRKSKAYFEKRRKADTA